MRPRPLVSGFALLVAAVSLTVVRAAAEPLPPSALAVRGAEGWRTWWRSCDAANPDSSTLAKAAAWRGVAPGVERADLELAGSGSAWRVRLVLVRLDPERLRFELVFDGDPGRRARWTVDRIPDDAVFAVNAGQFAETLPWGALVLGGRREFTPGAGPLASTFELGRGGAVTWRHGGAPPSPAADWAFQSYPTLVAQGRIPEALLQAGQGLDVAHRDARAAIGQSVDGRLLVALTRFDALGDAFGSVPFGLTSPEMAAVMHALGAREALMLDGGISAQLAVRGEDGRAEFWRGHRAVPVALIARLAGGQRMRTSRSDSAPAPVATRTR